MKETGFIFNKKLFHNINSHPNSFWNMQTCLAERPVFTLVGPKRSSASFLKQAQRRHNSYRQCGYDQIPRFLSQKTLLQAP